MKPIAVAVATVSLLFTSLPGNPITAYAAPQDSFQDADFSHPLLINNPYFPLRPGTTYIYRGKTDGVPTYEEFTVTSRTEVISGVRSRVVHDKNWEGGELIEDTLDWYAQDDEGNVWYMGEWTTQFENGRVVGHEGSWRAGTDGAQAGLIMKEEPEVGDTYRQEYLAGEAEDKAEVVSLNRSICVPYRCFHHVLQTKETTRLEPGVVEYKFYARGIGEIKAMLASGGSEVSYLVRIVRR